VNNVEVIIKDSIMKIDNIVYYEPKLDYSPREITLRMSGTAIKSSTENSIEDLFYTTQVVHLTYSIFNSTIFGEYQTSSSGTMEIISIHRRALRDKENLLEACGISFITIGLIAIGVYIEHVVRKQEKIEEIFEET